MQENNNLAIIDKNYENQKTIVWVTYGLHLLAFFTGITGIIAFILNLMKQGETKGTILYSHHTYLIRTFIFGLLFTIIGVATIIILVGFVILFFTGCWLLYRLIKGALRLSDNLEI